MKSDLLHVGIIGAVIIGSIAALLFCACNPIDPTATNRKKLEQFIILD